MWSTLLGVMGWSALALVVFMVAMCLVSRRVGKVAIVDGAWGLGFVVVALVSWLVGAGGPRPLLMLALVAMWGGRLAIHLLRRTLAKDGDDPRYVKLLEKYGGPRFGVVLVRVFLLQAAIIWFVSLPIQVTGATGGPIGWVALAGALLWLVGVIFESVGDAQLEAFKADPANKGTIMDRGLWSWTRHPNYFGDVCVWWGLWLVAAQVWPGVLTIVGPIAMTYVIVAVSGVRLTEQIMARRPGFAEYAARTSVFFPRPPRHTV